MLRPHPGLRLAGLLLIWIGLLTPLPVAAQTATVNPLLRLVHASPGAPAVAVYVDGQPATTALRFGETTPYARVPAGERRVQVVASGAGPTGQAFIDTRVDLKPGQAYTVVAADTPVKMQPVVLNDALASPAPGKAYVRLFHASPDAPSVADIAVAGGPVVFKGVAFKADSGYLPVDPASYRFEVRPAGTVQALATTDAISLAGGRIYTVFAIGQFSDNTFRAVIIPDNAQTGGVNGMATAGAGGMAAEPASSWPALIGALGLLASLGAVVIARRLNRPRVTPR
jgi:hypothetical protein